MLAAKSLRAACLAAVVVAPFEVEAAKEEKNPHLWEPRTKSVAVFKNGFGFFLREGDATLRDGWALAGTIPPAAFGSLAIYSAKEGELVDVVGAGPGEKIEFDDHDAPDTPAARRKALDERLRLNLKLVYTVTGKTQEAAGKLISVGGEYAVLEAENGNFAVPVEAITSIQVLDFPLRFHVEGAKQDTTTLGMAYLRQGITWIPEYTLRILDDKTAELTLRGTLVNEAEDLIDANVSFVVGVPNFAHTDYMAPIAVGQSIRAMSAAFAPAQMRSQIANDAFIFSNADTTRATQPADTGGNITETLQSLPQMEAASASDYTVYTREHLTVRRGEKAIVTLFVRKVSYSHLYKWTPPETPKHFLVLANDSDSAWTTGPCLALSGGSPLSEDTLRYTPAGSRGELPVTTAINLLHKRTETETDRQLRAHNPANNVYFDLVKLKGELQVSSFEEREIEITITAPVQGKPSAATDGGELNTDTDNLKLAERRGSITWKLKLAPKKSVTLGYEYERYVPSL